MSVSAPTSAAPRVIATDASFDPESCRAAVACTLDSKPLAAEIVEAATNVEAEAYGLQLALRSAAAQGLERVVFHCDCKGVVDLVKAPQLRRLRHQRELVISLRQQLRDNPGWKLRWKKRKAVGNAHRLARNHLRACAEPAAGST